MFLRATSLDTFLELCVRLKEKKKKIMMTAAS